MIVAARVQRSRGRSANKSCLRVLITSSGEPEALIDLTRDTFSPVDSGDKRGGCTFEQRGAHKTDTQERLKGDKTCHMARAYRISKLIGKKKRRGIRGGGLQEGLLKHFIKGL